MPPKKTLLSVAGILAGALVLAACSSGDDGGSPAGGAPASNPASPSVTPVSVTFEPNGGTGVSPATPIVVKAANGKLLDVSVTNAKGKAVAGKLAGNWSSTQGKDAKIVLAIKDNGQFTWDASGPGKQPTTIAGTSTFADGILTLASQGQDGALVGKVA